MLVASNKPLGLFGFVEVKEYLEGLLGQPVDLVMPDDIKPRIRERVLREAVSVVEGSEAVH